jgi:hypothetical protein
VSERLLLLPAPRELEWLDGECALDPGVASVRRDPGLPAEGYTLDIRRDGISISHADDAGLRYARALLAQIASQAAARLPALSVRDWPDFPVRGYMLDVSRDRVPTRDTLVRIVELMALLRLNHLELYTEHTFAYRDHQTVWRDASPITPDDVRWLDELCARHGIELSANQNSFGHMGRWLAHERYRPLAEAPEGWDTRFGAHLPAGVLAPDDASLEFVLSLWRELLPCFSSRHVNIGCDETFELGRGVSAGRVAELGRERVYLDFVERIVRALADQGCQVAFWGDVLRGEPELVRQLPAENTIALAWHYEAPTEGELPRALLERFAEFGVSEAFLRGFAGQVPAFADGPLPFWVCPGTSTWNSLVGRWANARANLLDAARVGLASGARGMLITDWGDNGHLQPPSVSFLPLAYGAAVAWCRERNADLDVAPLLDRFVFADEAQKLGRALEDLGGLYTGTGLVAANASPLFNRLVGGGLLPVWGSASPDGAKRVLETLQDALAALDASRPTCADGDLVRRELAQAARLARAGARRVATEAGVGVPEADDLDALIDEQRACWLLRSRPGGLSDSLARLEALRGN